MNNLILDLIFRTVLISIPEQAFIILFVLKTAGKASKILESKKKTGLYLFILAQGFMSNVPKLLGIDSMTSLCINLLITFIVVFIIERFHFWKLLIFTFIAYMIFAMLDILCVLAVMESASLTIEKINSDLLITFATTIFERSIQLLILYVLYFNRTSYYGISIKISDFMFCNKKKQRITIAVLIIEILLLLMIAKAFILDNVLNGLGVTYALILCILCFSAPFFTITYFIFYTKTKLIENKVFLKYYSKDIQEKIVKEIEIASQKGDLKTVVMLQNILQTVCLSENN